MASNSATTNAPTEKKGKETTDSSGDDEGGKGDAQVKIKLPKGQRRRKDGTVNKMSFDVDELEEGLYIQVEDEEDVEEVVEYEEVPDDEASAAELAEEGEKKEEGQEGEKTSGKGKGAGEDGGYKIRPDLTQKFRPGTVQVLIETVIKEKLEGKEYSMEDGEAWAGQILEEIHDKVKAQNYKRYKLISQVTLGERRGEGASSATRCLWDAEADCMATYTFLNDTIFCNGTVYGVYFY